MADWKEATALIVIDVQQGMDEEEYFGKRNNPACEDNVGRLLDAWRAQGWPIVFVQHDSKEPGSPLAPGSPGHAFKQVVSGACDLKVNKSVHSAFFGEPSLHAWLRRHGITAVAICGIQTNVCCETTARMASDIGYDTLFVIDATHTFDLPVRGDSVISADELSRTTAAVLRGEFARVVLTDELVS
jgi:nicotinamidase-related amidase